MRRRDPILAVAVRSCKAMSVAAAFCAAVMLVGGTDRALAQAKPFMASTPACAVDPNGNCSVFTGPINNKVQTLRRISLNIPAAGSVMVSVTGSGSCGTPEAAKADAMAGFQAQIVDVANAEPVDNGLGSLYAAIRLQPADATGSMNDFQSFNLSTSRIFKATAGAVTYYFRAKILVYSNVICTIRPLSMQAIYLPK